MEGFRREELADLILAVRAKDDSAFLTLEQAYRPLLLSLSSSYTPSEEYYYEACVGLYKAAMSYDLDQSGVTFGLYASIIIRRRLRAFHIANEREIERLDDGDVDDIPVDEDIIDRLMGEEAYRELCREMQELLSGLEYRVLMLWLDGYKTADIATALDMSAKSVDNAKARIMKKLRKGRHPRP